MKGKALHILLTSVLIMIVPLFYSFMCLRSMNSEGAQWYYSVIDFQIYFTDYRFTRYIDFFIQYPAVIFLRHFTFLDAAVANRVAAYILSFGWTFHPMFSLALTAWILRKYSRLDLFIFPFMGFLGAFMPASSYAVALALPAMSVFWPTFFFLLLSDGKRIWDYLFAALLLVALMYCYEPTIIFFLLFIGMGIAGLVLNKREKFFNIFFIVLSALAIAYEIKVISNVPMENKAPFWNSLYMNLGPFRILGLGFSVAVSFLLFCQYILKKMRRTALVISVLIAAATASYVLYYLQFGWSFIDLGWAYDARTTALPLTFILAFFTLLFSLFQKDESWIKTKTGFYAAAMVFVCTLQVAYIDWQRTVEWNFYYEKFSEFVLKNKGCIHIPFKDFIAEYPSTAVQTFGSGYTAIMAQVLKSDDPVIRTLVFVGKEGDDSDVNQKCPERKSDIEFVNAYGLSVSINQAKLKFSKLTP